MPRLISMSILICELYSPCYQWVSGIGLVIHREDRADKEPFSIPLYPYTSIHTSVCRCIGVVLGAGCWVLGAGCDTRFIRSQLRFRQPADRPAVPLPSPAQAGAGARVWGGAERVRRV